MDPKTATRRRCSRSRATSARRSTPARRATSLQKINAAYTLGGASLTAKTVEQTLPGVTIKHIIDINFRGFRRVVDAIGCVYVFVDRNY